MKFSKSEVCFHNSLPQDVVTFQIYFYRRKQHVSRCGGFCCSPLSCKIQHGRLDLLTDPMTTNLQTMIAHDNEHK